MKALLVHPMAWESMWNLKEAASVLGAKAASPPLPLLTVASLLPSSWALRLVDLNVRSLLDSDLDWADVVLVHAMVCHRASLHEVLARCRAAGKRVVGGGPLFTSRPDDYDAVDHLVLGEVETTLSSFLADLEAGCARHLYPPPERPDLSLTPLPRWDLIDINDYVWMTVQFSRGCPFRCEFCDVIRLYGRDWRAKSVPQITAELEALYATGWRGHVLVADDNFAAIPKVTRAMVDAISRWQRERRYPFVMATHLSVRAAADEDLLRAMADAGFQYAAVGIETPIDASLDEAGKTQNRSTDLLEAIRTIHRSGLVVVGDFIVGFDSDPPDVCERHLAFIQQAPVVMVNTGILQAYSGTPLYTRLAAEGRIRGDAAGDPNLGVTNIVTRIEARELRAAHWQLLQALYDPRHFYRRVADMMRIYQLVRPPTLNRRWIRGALVGALRLGVLDDPAATLRFWATLVHVLRVNRRAWMKFIGLAVFGKQMRSWVRRRSASLQLDARQNGAAAVSGRGGAA